MAPKGPRPPICTTFETLVLYKGHEYQVWSKLAQNIQRRCRKCEKLTYDDDDDDDDEVDSIPHLSLL